MSTVFDVAKYILDHYGPMSAMKLQKLTFYSQAMALVWDDTPIFKEDFEAWPKGPVCPVLYKAHEGMFLLENSEFLKPYQVDVSRIRPEHVETIETVCKSLADLSAFELSEMTHSEEPWQKAREGVSLGEACSNVISKQAMESYYEAHW